MDATERRSLIDFYLSEIDNWRAGLKATIGSPMDGQTYSLQMREEVKRLDKRIKELRAERPT